MRVRFQTKRYIACKHINLHRLLSLRGENFRWADLVSGNLKEVEVTSLATLALWNAIVKPPNPRQTTGLSTETVGAFAASASHRHQERAAICRWRPFPLKPRSLKADGQDRSWARLTLLSQSRLSNHVGSVKRF